MAVVTVWMNAFIPKEVEGYTRQLTVGPHKNKTAIPLPSVARTYPGNLFKPLGAGYLTDQRGFSNALEASARMKSVMYVDVSRMALVDQKHSSSGTTEVDLDTGEQLGCKVADMSRCKFSMVPAPRPQAGKAKPVGQPGNVGVKVHLSAAAGDPLVGMAADIDYQGVFHVFTEGNSGLAVSFDGKIDAFPAYDCYATYKGVTKKLFTIDPPAGNTVTNLLGPPNRPIKATVRFT